MCLSVFAWWGGGDMKGVEKITPKTINAQNPYPGVVLSGQIPRPGTIFLDQKCPIWIKKCSKITTPEQNAVIKIQAKKRLSKSPPIPIPMGINTDRHI